ncbi:choice-of-anchor L domain-containing protein [Neolewinella lacunae]|uniref:Choice-of-anchor L domain-containing protein n=1 Tax=Neolewinella lacunae TaxID=1517758 RepID=A0A923T803_9BACT|nr:choice-of-anchor L domain-containing protein [Neolewinella lacunae]MBC6994061.1 choice-of-anchor L domain-containing protein [Neolewinella lacunae]MDN3636068.1 choice-of-anchor L domain-containing protein [Neolewinella lacunae]
MKYLLLFASFWSLTGGLAAQSFVVSVGEKPVQHALEVTGTQEIKITLEGVAEGETYALYIANDREERRFSFADVPTGGTLRDGHYILGVGTGQALEVCVHERLHQAGTLYLSARKNRGRTAEKLMAMTAMPSTDADFLLNTVFRNESCFELTPIRLLSGDNTIQNGRRVTQTGVFGNGTATVGIEDGIVMTTGFVDDLPGPNDEFFPAGGSYPSSNNTDPDAAALAGAFDYYDVAVIEFEFVPTTTSISFDYIFFSEEYFACPPFAGFGNDAFAFYLEGPGVPGGRMNIARLPNGDNITAATLNYITTPSLYVDNYPGRFVPCSDTPVPPSRLAGISYDGFSQKLTATATVIPCETYRLKLVVVDVADPTLDSGVLLEAGSFTAGLIADPEPSVQGIPGLVTPLEGCDTAFLTFNRLFSDADDLALPLEVNYNLITTGTGLNLADLGLDFELPPPPFIIPAGDTSAVLKIPILADADGGEGVEAFILKYDGTCNCAENRDTFYIQDAVAMLVDIVTPDQGLCAGQAIQLQSSVSGGDNNFSYLWPDGQTSDNVSYVATGRDTTIWLTVSDGCGRTGRDSVRISASAISATVGGDYSLCSTPVVSVPVDVEGGLSYVITLRVDSNGVVTETDYTITQDTSFTFDRAASIRVTAVRDGNGCGGSTSGVAIVRDADVQVTPTLGQPDCGGSNGTIDLQVAGGNANFSFNWLDDGSITGGSRSNLPPASYTVEIARLSDPACPLTFNYTLTGPPPLVLDSVAYLRPACAGETILLAPVVSGGTPPYSFNWPDSVRTDSLLAIRTQNGSHSYQVFVTDACGEEVTGTVSFTLPAFSVSLAGRYSLCNASPALVPITLTGPAGDYAVTLQIDSAGTIFTRRLLLSPGVTDLTFSAAAVLTVLSLTNEQGCVGDILSSGAEIVDPQLRFTPTLVHPICRGDATGSIRLTDAGRVPLQYTWSDAGPGTPTRTGLRAGTYGVRIADAADPGCFRDTTFVLTEPAAFVVNAVAEMANCPGETITLAAAHQGGTPPYTYNWANGLGTDSLFTVTTLAGNNNYPLEITDACGQVLRDTVEIVLPDVTAMVSGNFSVCTPPFNADVPIRLAGSTVGYTFTVRENGVDRTLFATGDTLLNYTLATMVQLISVVAGTAGCPGMAGGIANVRNGNWEVEATVTPVLCAGENSGSISLNVNNNPSAYTYQWSPATLSGPNVSNLAAGTYRVTVTEQTPEACQWDTLITLLAPASAITFQGDSARAESCLELAYASATFTGGTPPLTYSWSNGASGAVLGDVPAGSYTLTVSDANGCEVVRNFSLPDLRQDVLALILSSGTELTCSQPSQNLSAAQGIQAVSYQWTGPGGTDLGTSRTISVAVPGDYVLNVLNPATGCTAADTLTITEVPNGLELELDSLYAITCSTPAVDLTVRRLDQSGVANFEWRFNGTIVGRAATLPNVTAPGVYTLTIIRQADNCSTSLTTEVIVDRTNPQVRVDQALLTVNCTDQQVNPRVEAEGPYRFLWTSSDGSISGAADGNSVSVTRPGRYEVLVTDTLNGCTTMATVRVNEDGDRLRPNAGADRLLNCGANGTVLEATASPNLPNTRFRWYDRSGTQLSNVARLLVSTAGEYILEAIHPVSGCSAFDTVRITTEAPAEVSYTLLQPPCPEVGGSLTVRSVTGTHPPFSYRTESGLGRPVGNGLRELPEGEHVLIVTDALGCELRDTFQIFSPGFFEGFAEDITVFLGEEIVLGAETNRGAGARVQWTWGNIADTSSCLLCPNPVVHALESFVATAVAVDTHGCVLQLRQQVFVRERDLVYLPDAFSPRNGDGVNDIYTVFGDADFVTAVESFAIFDRWGNQVFGNQHFLVNDPTAGWDGTYRGKASPPGVYVYSVAVRRYDGRLEVHKGGFILVE